MDEQSEFLCREIALLHFNRRVLAQARDERFPLLERLNFVCIVSSNLDEFFEVRVASVRRQMAHQPGVPLADGQMPEDVLRNIGIEAHRLVAEQYQVFAELLPLLQEEGIYFYHRHEWSAAQTRWIEEYFHHEIKPVVTPIGLDPSHPFPKLLNKSLNFVLELEGKDAFGRASNMAVVQAPRILPRVVALPQEICDGRSGFVFLSSIMHQYIQALFIGMEVKGFYQFRVTRDSDLSVDEVELTNLRTAIQSELHDRQYGRAVRLEVASNCPEHVVDFLLRQVDLTEEDVYRVHGPVNLVRVNAVPGLINRPDLKFPPQNPTVPDNIAHARSMFDCIRRQDILLHHPYQSFQPTVDLILQAAEDPAVVAIKMTIYRTGKNSDLIQGLIKAALAGKEVTVVVELMARFDEAANVNWASQLEEAGAHVVYGVFGYKVHAKMILVVRRENGELKRYAHLGTGNYHQGTSRLYTDFGLFTADPDITSDVNDIFIQITGLGQAGRLKKIYQSPFTLHPMIIQSINNERKNAEEGRKGRVMAKMNSLLEPNVIRALYAASNAGVQIDLVVRGICTLRPGMPGMSENIRVHSIIGRLLEHSRVFYFYNDGAEKVYISSADWMGRNFFHRVETCIPVQHPNLRDRVIREALTLGISDNRQGWSMNPDGSYRRIQREEEEEEISLQDTLLRQWQG